MLSAILKHLKRSGAVYLLLIILLSSFLSFWKLGSRPLYEWDESWYAIVTAEMMSRNDFVNYFFYDRPEYEVSKPPLFFWAVCVCYTVFGFNEWALRFPSALAAVLFFVVFFLWVRKYTTDKVAFFSCLVLCSCKAVIGYHVGRTGDTDAFVLLFLMLSLFQFSRYVDFGKKNAVLWCALFLGLAFYSKGTFAFLFIPSMFIYTIWRGKLKFIFSDFRFWLSVLLFMLIVSSWYLLVTIFAHPGYLSPTGAHNSFEQLFLYDTAKRFMQDVVGGKEKTGGDILYYFVTLDTNFNLWNYFCYLVILVFIVLNFAKIRRNIRSAENPFYILLALYIAVPFVLLTAAQTKLGWYLTPVISLIAILTVLLNESIAKRFVIAKFIFAGLLMFTLARQFIFINSIPVTRATLLQEEKERLLNASSIYWYRGNFEMDWLAYFRWYAHEVKPIDQQHLKALVVNDSFLIAGRLDGAIEDFLDQHPELIVKKADDHFIAFQND